MKDDIERIIRLFNKASSFKIIRLFDDFNCYSAYLEIAKPDGSNIHAILTKNLELYTGIMECSEDDVICDTTGGYDVDQWQYYTDEQGNNYQFAIIDESKPKFRGYEIANE